MVGNSWGVGYECIRMVELSMECISMGGVCGWMVELGQGLSVLGCRRIVYGWEVCD